MAVGQSVGEITKKYRSALGGEMGRLVPQEEFGEMLANGLLNTGISRMTIHTWETGKGEPGLDFLLSMYGYYLAKTDDWRFRWAVECLRVTRPDVFNGNVIKLASGHK